MRPAPNRAAVAILWPGKIIQSRLTGLKKLLVDAPPTVAAMNYRQLSQGKEMILVAFLWSGCSYAARLTLRDHLRAMGRRLFFASLESTLWDGALRNEGARPHWYRVARLLVGRTFPQAGAWTYHHKAEVTRTPQLDLVPRDGAFTDCGRSWHRSRCRRDKGPGWAWAPTIHSALQCPGNDVRSQKVATSSAATTDGTVSVIWLPSTFTHHRGHGMSWQLQEIVSPFSAGALWLGDMHMYPRDLERSGAIWSDLAPRISGGTARRCVYGGAPAPIGV